MTVAGIGRSAVTLVLGVGVVVLSACNGGTATPKAGASPTASANGPGNTASSAASPSGPGPAPLSSSSVGVPSAGAGSTSATASGKGFFEVELSVVGQADPKTALDAAAAAMRKRLAAAGLTTAKVEIDGTEMIVTGRAADKARLLALSAPPGVLELRNVLSKANGDDPVDLQANPATLARFKNLDCSAANALDPATNPPGVPIAACSKVDKSKYLLGPAGVSGSQITSVTAKAEEAGNGVTTGNWEIDVALNAGGAKAFADMTTAAFGSNGQIAVSVDGVVQEAFAVASPIMDGNLRITGSFDQTAAKDLAALISAGTLPRLRVDSTAESAG